MARSNSASAQAQAQRWRRASATVLGFCLLIAAATVASRSGGVVELFEGYTSLSSGEDAALRHLYDWDGERVPGAVIASEAEADADVPKQARRAVRAARENLAAVQEAATAASILDGSRRGAKSASEGSQLQAWQAQMDRAMDTHASSGRSEEGAAKHKATSTVLQEVRKKLDDENDTEQSKDQLKEEMQSIMRHKLSAMTLNMHRQLRKEKELAQQSARRQAKAMHSEIESLKRRMLHQREHMETELIHLSTKEHHYKDEKEITSKNVHDSSHFDGQEAEGEMEKEKARKPESSKEGLRTQVEGLNANLGKVKIMPAKSLDKSTNSINQRETGPTSSKTKGEEERRKIASIERGFFKNQLSSYVARDKMAKLVIKDQARQAARAVRQQQEQTSKAPTTKTPLSASHLLTPPQQQQPSATAPALMLQPGGATAQPLPAHAAQPQPPSAVAFSQPAPGSEGETAVGASMAQASGGGQDADLRKQLQAALVSKNAAEAELESFLLKAKNREISALQSALALDQRMLALQHMQERAADLGMMQPVGEQVVPRASAAFEDGGEPLLDALARDKALREQTSAALAAGMEEREAAAPMASLEDAVGTGLGDSMMGTQGPTAQTPVLSRQAEPAYAGAFGPEDTAAAFGFGDRMERVAGSGERLAAEEETPVLAYAHQTRAADQLERPAYAWDPLGEAGGINFRDRIERIPRTHTLLARPGSRGSQGASSVLKPGVGLPSREEETASLNAAHLRLESLRRPRVGVDRVPEWSPRVKELKLKALKAGFKLVPLAAAHAGASAPSQHSSAAADELDTGTSQAHAARRFTGVEGQQALAAATVQPHAGVTVRHFAPASSSAAEHGKEEETEGNAQEVDTPEGLDGASLLDQIGRVFYKSAKGVFNAL